MLGDQRLRLVVLAQSRSGPVEITLGDGAVGQSLGREERFAETVLVDQLMRHDPEDLSPDFADGVNTPVSGPVEGLVRRRVDLPLEGIDVVADTAFLVGGPGTHGEVLVVLGTPDGRGKEIAPTFTHASTLTPGQTSTIQRSTGQTRAETVGEFVNDDAGFEITVPVRVGSVPDVHPATTVLTVWGRHEVGLAKNHSDERTEQGIKCKWTYVVIPATVLGVRDDTVAVPSTATKVLLLEVAGLLVEPIPKEVINTKRQKIRVRQK